MPDIRSAIDALAGAVTWSKAAGWDPVGLQVGDAGAPTGRLGVCHDVTSSVLDAAEQAGVGLLVAYHPLLFDATRNFIAGSGPSGLAFRAARAGIAIVVVHTGFDVAPGGTADAMAETLELADAAPFGPLWGGVGVKVVTFVPEPTVDEVVGAMSSAGAGEIGGYTACSFRSEGIGSFVAGAGTDPAVGAAGEATTVAEVRVEMVAPEAAIDRVVAALVAAHPYEEPAYDVFERRDETGFVGRVGRWSGTAQDLGEIVSDRFGGVVRRAGPADAPVATVAVVPGSGASFAGAARAAGADAIVTGDVKHHEARAAVASGLGIVDPGHAATERPGVARLYAAVAAAGFDPVDLTAVDADPWAN